MFPFVLAIHTYPGGSAALIRHAPYFENSGATRKVAITTEDGECEVPKGWESISICKNSYMNGDHLPMRLMRTVALCLTRPENHFVIAEYDTLFFKPVQPFTGICADHTGGQTWGSKSSFYSHNPWCFDRDSAYPLLNEMVRIIAEGHCAYGTPESSPDVFFAYACERVGLPVKHDHFQLFTRNCFDLPGDLELARQAYREGVDVLHGVKTKQELEFITS